MAEELKGVLKERYQQEYQQFMAEEARKVIIRSTEMCTCVTFLYQLINLQVFLFQLLGATNPPIFLLITISLFS